MAVNAKPFSLQSPEEIAKTYDGNKQRIAQAVQQGVVDPTSGLLAGMFIDRIRSAAAQEQAPQRTVAQQVFTPRPPMQQGAPAGLASISPQAAPMAPPQRPAAPPPQQMPAMAGGGLADLPLPEDMFDEQSFSGGGIVAFADAGSVDAEYSRLQGLYAALNDPSATPEQRAQINAEIRQLTQGAAAPEAQPYQRGQHTWLGNLIRGQGVLGANAPAVPGSTADIVTNLLTGQGMAATKQAAPVAPPAIAAALPTAPTADTVPPASVGTLPADYVSNVNEYFRGQTPPPSASEPKPAPATAAAPTSAAVPTPPPSIPITEPTPAPPDVSQADFIKQYIQNLGSMPKLEQASAEERAQQRREDQGELMLKAASALLGTPGSFGAGVSKAFAEIAPDVAAQLKERRAETREDRKDQFAQAMAEFGIKKDAQSAYQQHFEKQSDRNQQIMLENLRTASAEKIANMNAASDWARTNLTTDTQKSIAQMETKARKDIAELENTGRLSTTEAATRRQAIDAAVNNTVRSLQADLNYQRAPKKEQDRMFMERYSQMLSAVGIAPPSAAPAVSSSNGAWTVTSVRNK